MLSVKKLKFGVAVDSIKLGGCYQLRKSLTHLSLKPSMSDDPLVILLNRFESIITKSKEDGFKAGFEEREKRIYDSIARLILPVEREVGFFSHAHGLSSKKHECGGSDGPSEFYVSIGKLDLPCRNDEQEMNFVLHLIGCVAGKGFGTKVSARLDKAVDAIVFFVGDRVFDCHQVKKN